MKKHPFLLFALLFGLSLASTAQAAFVVKDTVLADGYYAIRNFYAGNDSVVVMKAAKSSELPKLEGMNLLYLESAKIYWNAANDIPARADAIFHLVNHPDGATLKNCGPLATSYLMPEEDVKGQADYIAGVGREYTRWKFRINDYGSSSTSNTGAMDKAQTASKVKAKIGGVEQTVQGIFVVPVSNVWRMRPGNSALAKLNSNSEAVSASWYFEKVDITGYEAWFKLRETFTDVTGPNYQVGDNPGYVNSISAMIAFEEIVNKAMELMDMGGTDEQYLSMVDQLKAAETEIQKHVVPIEDGYYIIRNHCFRERVLRPFGDYMHRQDTNSGKPSNDYAVKNSYTYMNPAWFLGYKLSEIDTNTATCPQEIVWHLVKASDSTYYFKNCAESSRMGDSTYFDSRKHDWPDPFPTVTQNGQHPFRGTPTTSIRFFNIYGNWVHMFLVNNRWKLNLGLNNFCTNNTCNNATEAGWELERVPASRITPKWTFNEAITDAAGIFVDWIVGIDPGQLKPAIAAPLQAEIASARAVYANPASTDADFAAAEASLRAATEALKIQLKDTATVTNPLNEDGYYRLENYNQQMYYGWKKSQYNGSGDWFMYDNVEMDYTRRPTMYATESGALYWDLDFDRSNPYKLWHITNNPDGTAYIQNVMTGQYLGIADNDRFVSTTDSPQPCRIVNNNGRHYNEDGHIYEPTKGQLQLFLQNENRWDYPVYMNDHQSGRGTGSTIRLWQGYWGTYWYLRRETDRHNIDSLRSASKALAFELQNAMDDAQTLIDYNTRFTWNEADSIITDLPLTDTQDPADYQVTSNLKHIGRGTYHNLIDGDPRTRWESMFSASGGMAINDVPGDAYLQIDLKEPMRNVALKVTMTGCLNPKDGPMHMPIRYGISDNGVNYRPTKATIYASNDTLDPDGWKQVKMTRDIVQDKECRDVIIPIQMDEPYRFIRYEVNSTKGGYTYGKTHYWEIGGLQAYKMSIDAANSAIEYNAETKAAANRLKTAIAEGKTALADNTASTETVAKVNSAKAEPEAISADPRTLQRRIWLAEKPADSTYVYDDAKDALMTEASEAEKAAFLADIQRAKDIMNAQPDRAAIENAVIALDQAHWAFNSKRRTFDRDGNTWYYIRNAEKQSYETVKNWAWRGGHWYYACGNDPQPAYDPDKSWHNIYSAVRWGHYVEFNGLNDIEGAPKPFPKNYGTAIDYTGGRMDNPNNPYLMWRIVKFDGQDSVFALQNRANGLYMGRRQDMFGGSGTNGQGNWITLSTVPMPLNINEVGHGQYEVATPWDSIYLYHTSERGARNSDLWQALHVQGEDFRAVWWSDKTKNPDVGADATEAGFNTGSAVIFEPVDEDLLSGLLDFSISANDARVMSLPFELDVEEVFAGTDDLAFYTLNNIRYDTDSSTTLELSRKDRGVFKAGEPFIVITGNPALHAAHDSVEFYLPVPTNYEFEPAQSANGLVAQVYGDSILKEGIGFFANGVLKGTSDRMTFIHGFGGYVNPSLVQDLGGSVDATIVSDTKLTGVGSINIARTAANNNVYGIDGKLIRKAGGDAMKGLQSGLYIVGKRKVYVQ